MEFLAQINLKEAQDIVASPTTFALFLVGLALIIFAIARSLVRHLDKCEQANAQVAVTLATQNVMLMRIDANCQSASTNAQQALQRIALLEGASRRRRRDDEDRE